MSLIKWDNSFNLRVMVMDEHHRHLVSLLNKSYNDIRINDKVDIELVLKELIDYTEYHFGTEEEMMGKYGFPSLLMHKQEHAYFCHQVDKLQTKLKAGEALYNIHIVVFLKDWLLNHILVADRELADYLLSKGVA